MMAVFCAPVAREEDVRDALCAVARHDSSPRLPLGVHGVDAHTRGASFDTRATVVVTADADVFVAFDQEGDGDDTAAWFESRGHSLFRVDPEDTEGSRTVGRASRRHGIARIALAATESATRRPSWFRLTHRGATEPIAIPSSA